MKRANGFLVLLTVPRSLYLTWRTHVERSELILSLAGYDTNSSITDSSSFNNGTVDGNKQKSTAPLLIWKQTSIIHNLYIIQGIPFIKLMEKNK